LVSLINTIKRAAKSGKDEKCVLICDSKEKPLKLKICKTNGKDFVVSKEISGPRIRPYSRSLPKIHKKNSSLNVFQLFKSNARNCEIKFPKKSVRRSLEALSSRRLAGPKSQNMNQI
jgi:hypothetical protein